MLLTILDCDDTDNTVYPGATEICDGKDNDCNGTIDEGVTTTYYADADGDGFGDAGVTTQDCSAPAGYVADNTDCDDTDNTVYPGAIEICDGKDNDCNGTIDEGVTTTYYADADGDGFGDAGVTTQDCSAPAGYVADNTDCDDTDNTVYPGAIEICDGKDNDCNGTIDEGVTTTYYADADGDGFGDAGVTTQDCSAPAGYVADNTDCDDTDNTVYPGATEICDGKDNNCNGSVDYNDPSVVLATVYNVTGGGSYCDGGSGVPVGLSNSEIGVEFQLFKDGSTAVGSPVAGTGTAISFGNQTVAGTYTVEATHISGGCINDMSGQAVVTVDPEVNAGTISGTTSICISETTQLSTDGDAGGVWESSNHLIATVDSNGLVTAHAQGNADITYTINIGCGAPDSDTLEITVNPNVVAGTISGADVLCIGASENFEAVGGEPGGIWSSSNTGVATVDENTGEVTAVNAGTTTIKYEVTSGCGNPVEATKLLTVNPNVVAGTISGVTALCIGEVQIYSSNGDSGGVWSSSNPAVASIDTGSGETTALTAGSTTLSYTIEIGCGAPQTSTFVVTVNELPNNGSSGFTGGTICLGENAILRFDALNNSFVAPYYIEYTDGIDTWSQLIPTADSENIMLQVAPTSTTTYTLVSITNGNGCVRTSGFGKNTAQITVRPTADASISGNTTVCKNDPATVTFTRNTIGTSLSFTYAYTINNGPELTATGNGNINLSVDTSEAGIYEYELISVGYTTNPECTQFINEVATITVNQQTDISNPSNQNITYGENATFSINATGTNISYQWQVDEGSGFGDISDGGFYSGALTNTLNISLPTVSMGGNEYRVVVTGDCGVETSDLAILSVDPLAINVTADDQTKVYGDADPALTYQHAPALVAGDTFSGALSRVAGEDVGTYAIEQGTLAISSNYVLNFTAGELEITPLTVAVTADDQTKVYGDADPALTYQHAPALVAGDTFSGALSRVAGEDVGTYAIEQGTLALSSNYILNFTAGELEITPLTIAVTADDQTKVYGDVDPALTFISSPAVGDVLANGELISFSGALSRVPGENVGTYAIEQNTLDNTNYAITYNGALLTIGQLAVTVDADAQGKTYGDVDPALTFVSSPAVGDVLANGELISFSGALSRVPGENVGTYAIEQNTLDNTNYAITYNGALLTIGQLAVTVDADAQGKTYGDVDPALTFISSPAVGDVLANGELISFSGALSRVPGENVGTYAIEQNTLDNTNYAITYNGALLTIGQLAVTVDADAQGKTYGDVDPALTFVSSPAVGDVLANGELISFSGALSRVPGENVGTYAIEQNTLDNTNYAITYNGALLTIGQLAVTVDADAQGKTYGDVDPALTFVSSPAVGDVLANGELISFSGALSRVPGENVGTYAIEQNTLDNTNYAITYNGALLTIGQLAVTVDADAQGKTYGDVDPALTFISSPAVGDVLANGELISFSGALSRVPGENVGTYAIEQNTLDNTNYAITYNGALLTIGQLAVTVDADAQGKTYGDVDPALTFISSPAVGDVLANGELISFSGALSRVPGENVGTYAIEQNTLDNTNYAITYNGALLTIGQLAVTVDADAQGKTYGDVDPALTFISSPAVGDVLANGELISFSGALSRVPGENVGTYAIEQNTLDNTNYAITYNGALLTITNRPITITVDAGQTKVYGEVDPVFTYSFDTPGMGLAPLDEFTGELARAPGETVAGSPYAINKGTLLIVDENNNSIDKESNYTITFIGADFTITQATVTATIDVDPDEVQYSDLVTFTATIEGGAPLVANGPQAAQSATFKVNSLVMGTADFIVSGADLVAVLADVPMLEPSLGEGTMAPGVKTVSAEINNVDGNYNVDPNPVTTNLTILQEDADIQYNGLQLFATSGGNSTSALVNLKAVIQDALDNYSGDIRNATVQFKVYDADANTYSLLPNGISPELNVTEMLIPGDYSRGIVNWEITLDIGNNDSKTFGVEIIVDGYYIGKIEKEDLLITVYKPVGDFITGGGFILPQNPSPAVGLYPSDEGTRTNFGFNVKFNANGRNLKGRLNFIWRTDNGRIFQVRSNSIQSLGVDISNEDEKIAVFVAKSNVRDLSPNSLPIPNSGNVEMYVTMTDKGEPGVNDEIGFTLWRGNELWYSSNWEGLGTEELYLSGGNLIVHSGFSTGNTKQYTSPQNNNFLEVESWPNPSDDVFSIIVNSPNTEEPIHFKVYDIAGRFIEESFGSVGETFRIGDRYSSGVYAVKISQGGIVKYIKLVKK